MTVGEVFISGKSCKMYKNKVKGPQKLFSKTTQWARLESLLSQSVLTPVVLTIYQQNEVLQSIWRFIATDCYRHLHLIPRWALPSHVSHSPVPEITWRRANGVPFPSKVKMKYSNAVLEIPSFQQDDTGGYECVAENKMGKNTVTGRLAFYGTATFVWVLRRRHRQLS